jgi:hypothetical protein
MPLDGEDVVALTLVCRTATDGRGNGQSTIDLVAPTTFGGDDVGHGLKLEYAGVYAG